jgi:hypothetical protein
VADPMPFWMKRRCLPNMIDCPGIPGLRHGKRLSVWHMHWAS